MLKDNKVPGTSMGTRVAEATLRGAGSAAGFLGERRERMGKNLQGLRSIIGRYKNRQEDVQSSIGNGEAKELICTTHEHELRSGAGGNAGGKGCTRQRVAKGEKIGTTVVA